MSDKATTEHQSILLERLPRDLVQQLKRKVAGNNTMRGVIVQLIQDYVDGVIEVEAPSSLRARRAAPKGSGTPK